MIKVSVLEDEVTVRIEGEVIGGSGGGGDPYSGAYEATPTQAEQVFRTGGFSMVRDFVVHPIPQNYGLITYNGFHITVS